MRRGEEEQATDIKSNNPHLAGGEKLLKTGRFDLKTPTSRLTQISPHDIPIKSLFYLP